MSLMSFHVTLQGLSLLYYNIQEQLRELERIIKTDKRILNHFKKAQADGEEKFDKYIADNKFRF